MQSLKIPAKLENLHTMMAFVRSFMESNNTNNTAIMQTELAIEEVLVNIINYAYPDKNGDIEVSCEWESGRKAIFKIFDNGTPFDSVNKKEPDITIPIEEKSIGGLGIFLLKKMMDDVKYERVNAKNVLTLVKQC